MAYKAKYIFPFTDLYGSDWRAVIEERDFTGDTLTLYNRGSENMLSLEWQGQKDIYAPIIPSLANLSIYATSNLEFRDLITTDPKKVKLVIQYYDGNNWVDKWQGFMVPDLYREDFTDAPYLVEMRFIDGLGLLKNIEYNPIGPGIQKVTAVINQIFNQVNEKTWFKLEAINIHETSTTFDDSTSVLDQHYVNENAYVTGKRTEADSNNDPNNDVTEYMSCYKVLEELMKVFNARCWYDILTFDETPTLNIANPNFIGEEGGETHFKAYTGTSTLYNLKKEVVEGGGINDLHLIGDNASLDFYQPRSLSLAKYEAEVNNENLIKRGAFEYTDTSQKSISPGLRGIRDWTLSDSNVVIEDYRLHLGGLALRDTPRSEYVESPSTTFAFLDNIKIRFDFRVDFPKGVPGGRDYLPNKFWLSLDLVIIGPSDTYRLTWDSTDGFYFEEDSITVNELSIQVSKKDNYQLEFEETVNAPVSNGDIFVRLHGVDDARVWIPNGQQITLSSDALWGNFFAIPEFGEGIRSKVDNGSLGNESNSEPIEVELKHSDGTPFVDFGAMALNDSAPLTPTESWNIQQFYDYDSDLSHTKIIARERLKGYTDHRRRLKGELLNNNIATFSSLLLVAEGNTNYGYLFYKFKWDIGNCRANFEAFEILVEAGEISFDDQIGEPFEVGNVHKGEIFGVGWPGTGGPNYTPIVTEDNTVIPAGTERVIFDPCEIDTPTMYLPNINDTSQSVRVKIECSNCSNKDVKLLTNENDSSTIGGEGSIKLQCGESIELTPTANGWVVSG